MTAMMTVNSKSIGERRRRWKPTSKGTCLSPAWSDLRIVPIRSDAVAPHLCHQGRVLVFSGHATFQPTWTNRSFSLSPAALPIEATPTL